MLFKRKNNPSVFSPPHEASGGETIYTGNLCAKCHDRAMTRAFLLGGGFATILFAELLLFLGTGKGEPAKNYSAMVRRGMLQTFTYIDAGVVKVLRVPWLRHPEALLIFGGFFASFIVVPCSLVWLGWQWKLAHHGVPSKLGWLYTRTVRKWRYLKFWDRHTEADPPAAPLGGRPIPGP